MTSAAQIGQLQCLHRRLIWKTTGAAVITPACLLGGGAWLSASYTRAIRGNQLSAGLMKACNDVDIVLCGDGMLCANVDSRSTRYGKRGQYVPVKSC